MGSLVEIFIERADNEILAAESLKKLSEDETVKEEFELPAKTTFYSSVISHSYYAIFYSAKALLLTRNVKTTSPNVHAKTYESFKKLFVITGILDKKLLEIYEETAFRASDLLEIFKEEKWKRGTFTYQTIPQANKEPSEESLANSKIFLAHIKKVLEKKI